MSDIYKAPKSELNTSKYHSLIERLLKEQSMPLAIFAVLLGTLGTLVLLSFARGIIPLYVYVIPGFIAGILVKFMGRPVTASYRVIPGLLSGVIVSIWVSLGGISIYTFLLPLLNILCCLAVSRRRLNYEEEKALYKYRHGLVKL
ncbi:hypothetical protein [Microbulbifer sp. VAAF005]|uniref:hypothetical protein n=1 Tax=unclassified Microbulbifer TaxID=2619833 RepID=UPI0024ADD24E|nr:hypothetical protein [Microbulbifer sp. VAAF005]WHI46723.1 hypothetical protein P0078_23990 [Microbulbifer sp. VAAF005]